MSFFSKLFGKDKKPPDKLLPNPSASDGDEPFMEYPSDDYASSLEAMTSALERLSMSDNGERWITFCAQGKGHDEDSYESADVRVRNNMIDLRGQKLDLPALLQFAKLDGEVEVQIDPAGMVTLPGATPQQMSRFLNAVFQKHFGIRPQDDEEDYAVGAEW